MSKQTRGRFITVEGVEGVGKTTNIAFIKAYLSAKNIDFIATREPGGTPLAEELRALLLAEREEPVDADAELLMMFAARAQHLNHLILPSLNRGQWVLSDRFTDATYAYQGGGRHLSKSKIQALESLVQGECQPDLTLFLDLDVEIGLQRARARGELDRFEQEQASFFQNVRSAYHERCQDFPERFKVVDASQSLAEVQKQIAAYLDDFIQ